MKRRLTPQLHLFQDADVEGSSLSQVKAPLSLLRIPAFWQARSSFAGSVVVPRNFRLLGFLLAGLMLISVLIFPISPVSAGGPVVRAVLFWADGCPACHAVIADLLPGLTTQYGDQLDIQLIEVSETLNYDYFRMIEDLREVPAGRRGVPALFIGDDLLVGAEEIPAKLPGLITKYLEAGGVGYPDLPDLAARLPEGADVGGCAPEAPCDDEITTAPRGFQGIAMTTLELSPTLVREEPGFEGRGLGIAIMVLLALSFIYASGGTLVSGLGRGYPVLPEKADILIPVLAVIGLGVVAYLTFVETQNVSAVCGPVGDCNAVQSSPYAKLFGLIPVGLLGLAGYIGILAAWLAIRFGGAGMRRLAGLAMLGMALFGVLFTMYLTYLELFIILAICAWCLASAVIISLLLVLSLGPAVDALMGE